MIKPLLNNAFSKQYGWVFLLSSALLIMLIMLSQILQNASQFAASYNTLLVLSLAGLALLFGFLIQALLKLYSQFKAQQAGIKLTLKLSRTLALVVGVPIAIIYYFAISFIHQGIDQWFDVKTEAALQSAVSLVRAVQNDQVRQELNHLLALVEEEAPELIRDPISTFSTINRIRIRTQAQEAAIYSKNGQLIAYSSQFDPHILPNKPNKALFQQVRQQHTFAAIESVEGSEDRNQVIRLIVPVKDDNFQTEYILQVILPISQNITLLANNVKIASSQYKELSYLKGPLKTSFTLILSLVLLLTLISAILFIIQTIQTMMSPIRTLSKGTKAVMSGDYSIKMPIETRDELGQLIESFNQMTKQVAKSRNDIKFSHQETEIQKLYLQTIIKNLKSGVITFDEEKNLKIVNNALNDILNVNLHSQLGKPLKNILGEKDFRHINTLVEQIFELFNNTNTWHEQLEFDSLQGQKILLIHGSIPPSLGKKSSGYIVVIEDITQIVQAQMQAAWSDVAQRLAHEIKNPLTPIQLSAERIHYKLHKKLHSEDQELLSRLTNTIVDQVDAMKNLVQAFTEYADTPEIHRRKLNINELIEDVISMYLSPNSQWHITCELDKSQPIIHADPGKLRQLFHNLIKNALEACENQNNISIIVQTKNANNQLKISVCDNGPGIPAETKNWIFEPYSTDKPKGTGLGLAIVKKIVDEHQGSIQVESVPNEGTCFIMTLSPIQKGSISIHEAK